MVTVNTYVRFGVPVRLDEFRRELYFVQQFVLHNCLMNVPVPPTIQRHEPNEECVRNNV